MELKTLSTKVDQYISLRDKRLAQDRKAASLKEQENLLRDELLQVLRESKVGVAGGRKFNVTRTVKDKPSASDWGQIYEFMKENDAMDLMQKRLNESAVEARWEDGITIPGVTKFPVEKLSISKVK